MKRIWKPTSRAAVGKVHLAALLLASLALLLQLSP
jgi:hypothetical protein